MEERNKSSNGKKNKSQRLGFTVGGGDGVGGIVLLGGGLAVAGLITAFSIIKNSNRKKYDGSANPSNKKQDATQGVSYFLQTPSTTLQQNQNSCITSHETSKIAVTVSHSDSPERLSIHSLALGDQAVPISDGDKENPSNFHSENFSNFSAKEFSLPAPDGSSLAKSEEMIKNESGEKKTVEVKKEDGELETKNLAVEENLPIQLAQEEEGEGDEEQGEEENDDGKSSEDVTEDEEEVESWEEESSLEEHSPIQSVEEEEKEDGAGEGEKEGLIMKEGESSSDEWSVEDEGKRENESGEMRKLAVEQNLPTQSVEEEESDDCSKHNIEEEKGLEGKFSVGENAAIKSAEKEREDSHDNNDEDSAEEHVMEKDEESSEGTVSSSNESNVEAIWPAEIIEALSQELKEMNAINKNSGEKTANKTEKYDFLDCKIKHEDKGNKETTENTANVFHQKPAQLVAMINDLTVNDLNRRIWVWSILVLLLLLLLLLLFHIHRTPAAAELVCHDPVMVLPRVE